MAGQFLGKWTVYLQSDGFMSYMFSTSDIPLPLLCLWAAPEDSLPPGKTANIAFMLRDDGQICFQFSNGQFVGPNNGINLDFHNPMAGMGFTFVDTLESAGGFSFSEHDPQQLPTTFSDMILFSTARLQLFIDPWTQLFVTDSDLPTDPSVQFTMTQVTPSLAQIAANSYQGTGLDFSWVDFSNLPLINPPFMLLHLAGSDFSNANLSGSQLFGCFLDNCNMESSNLTGTGFCEVTLNSVDLTNANLTNASFFIDYATCALGNATLKNCNLAGTNFTSANLSGANLVGSTFAGTIFTYAILTGAIFTGADLTGAIVPKLVPPPPPGFPESTIPQFYATPLSAPSPTNPRTNLVECRLNQSLLGNDWSMLDLTGATILNLSSPLSTKANPLLARYSILKGLNDNNLSHLSLQYAVFDNAILDRLDFSYTDLTNASFVDASLHGTNLTGATLAGAKMTGAQMGSLSLLFSLPLTFQSDLNAGTVDSALSSQFLLNGITLSQTATLSSVTTGAVWQLNDAGNDLTYTIRLETDPTSKSQTLGVYSNTTGATLSYAYMPDANLNGASLYGATADFIHFYDDGSGSPRLDDATLELARFSNSNLSKVNFKDAKLFGTDLGGAHLFNASFKGAFLTPTVNGVPATLVGANLQGADFTDAKLDQADLTNAAVAINISPDQSSPQGGVYLFSLPYHGDANTLEQYQTELTAHASFMLPLERDTRSLQDYVTALNAGQLAAFTLAFIVQQPSIKLTSSARIDTVPNEDAVWQIVDGTQTYNLWKEAVGQDSHRHYIFKLFVAPSLPNLQAAFLNNSRKLRWQARVTTVTAGSQWSIDNDSQNPVNSDTGYVTFAVKLNGSVLDVYGTSLRITRLDENNNLGYYTETCNVTKLTAANMNSETVCPNGTTLDVNRSLSGVDWDDKWLRASQLPSPPTCVPLDNFWCPASQTANPSS
jgi:uncharacterized protein YjbI with pentapeptide repeats